MNRAVFLDRDGVLNKAIVRNGRPSPPASVPETIIFEDAKQSLLHLSSRGFLLLVVTNQPDVARGTVATETVDRIHSYLKSELPINEFWTCFHDDADDCACRKPRPGLIQQAAARHAIDLGASFMVGDRWRDIEAGRAAGCKTILVERGYHERRAVPDVTVSSLSEAVDWILQNCETRQGRANLNPVYY